MRRPVRSLSYWRGAGSGRHHDIRRKEHHDARRKTHRPSKLGRRFTANSPTMARIVATTAYRHPRHAPSVLFVPQTRRRWRASSPSHGPSHRHQGAARRSDKHCLFAPRFSMSRRSSAYGAHASDRDLAAADRAQRRRRSFNVTSARGARMRRAPSASVTASAFGLVPASSRRTPSETAWPATRRAARSMQSWTRFPSSGRRAQRVDVGDRWLDLEALTPRRVLIAPAISAEDAAIHRLAGQARRLDHARTRARASTRARETRLGVAAASGWRRAKGTDEMAQLSVLQRIARLVRLPPEAADDAVLGTRPINTTSTTLTLAASCRENATVLLPQRRIRGRRDQLYAASDEPGTTSTVREFNNCQTERGLTVRRGEGGVSSTISIPTPTKVVVDVALQRRRRLEPPPCGTTCRSFDAEAEARRWR